MRIAPHHFEASPIAGFHGERDGLGVACFLSGTARAPSEKQAVLWDCLPSWIESTPERDNRFLCGGDWFAVELEYAPSVPVLHGVLSRGESRFELEIRPRGPLPAGIYTFGLFGRRYAEVRTDEPTVVVLRDFELDAADALSGLADPEGEDPLAEAHRLLALGRPAEALPLYLRAGSDDPRGHAQAAFFAAVALHRLGRAEAVREALRALRGAAPSETARLLAESWAGLSAAERAVFGE
jgi:hypothetical protein